MMERPRVMKEIIVDGLTYKVSTDDGGWSWTACRAGTNMVCIARTEKSAIDGLTKELRKMRQQKEG